MELRDLPTRVIPHAAESDKHRRLPYERLVYGAFWCHERTKPSIHTTYEAFTSNKNRANPYPTESFS